MLLLLKVNIMKAYSYTLELFFLLLLLLLKANIMKIFFFLLYTRVFLGVFCLCFVLLLLFCLFVCCCCCCCSWWRQYHEDIFFLLYTRAQKLSKFLQQCTEVETSVNYGHRNSTGGRLGRWSTSFQHVFRYTPVYLYSAWSQTHTGLSPFSMQSNTHQSPSIQHAVRYTLVCLHSTSNQLHSGLPPFN